MTEKEKNKNFVAKVDTSEAKNLMGRKRIKKRRSGLRGLGRVYTKGGIRFQIGGPKKMILRNGGL